MSSQNGGRSPKDLRHLLSVARQDDSFFPEEVKVNLEKLKSLSKDELSENSMLRDRIDQQSELICILKKQADSSLNKSLTLEKDIKDLESAKEEAVCNYHDEMRKYSVLEKRFEILFHNHEEIIKIKDGYKVVNDELRRENKELVNKKLEDEASAIIEKNATIKTLRDELETLEKKFQTSEEQLRTPNSALFEKGNEKTLKDQFISSEKLSCEVIENLKIKVSNAEQKAQEIEQKGSTTLLQLLSSEKEMKKLQEEKDKYAQIASDQKETCVKQEQEISALLANVKELELSLKRQGEKFTKEIESASADAQVRKLKTELKKAEGKIRNHDKVKMEFEAYRTHTEKLLSKERELNFKLRQLIG